MLKILTLAAHLLFPGHATVGTDDYWDCYTIDGGAALGPVHECLGPDNRVIHPIVTWGLE